LHEPFRNVSPAFVVAPVRVSAKRVVEDYFYVRERAVIQLRHGNLLICSQVEAIAFSSLSEFAALWTTGNGTAVAEIKLILFLAAVRFSPGGFGERGSARNRKRKGRAAWDAKLSSLPTWKGYQRTYLSITPTLFGN